MTAEVKGFDPTVDTRVGATATHQKGDMTTRLKRRRRWAAWLLGALGACAFVAGTTVPARAAAMASLRFAADGADATNTRRSTLALAQERLDAARTEANAMAERMAAAQTQQAKLAADIAASEAEIPLLRARATALRDIVRARAVRLYVRGGSSELDAAVSAATVLDASRAAYLTQTIGNHDAAIATELVDTAHQLEVREAQLRAQRDDLARSVAALVPLQDQLTKRLAHASDAYDKVKAALAQDGKTDDVSTGAQTCPVRGFVVFTDDFGQPRDGGTLHQGIDMPAKEGLPVIAVVDGLVVHEVSEGGGNGLWLYGADDVAYYYAHLVRYEGDPWAVKAGDVIGYVGTTGVSTGPHLHFEVHPHRGLAVDGFSLLLGLCAEETSTPRG